MLDSQLAHAIDLAELEALAVAHRVPVYDAKPHQLFRTPDSLLRALGGRG